MAALAVSLSGHGRSDPPVGGTVPQVAVWLEELEDVLEAVAWRDTILVGNSFGAGGALLFASSRRILVRGLCLVAGSPGGHAVSLPSATRRVLSTLYRATRPPFSPPLIERLIRRQLQGLAPEDRQQLLPLSLATHPAALEASARFAWIVNLEPLLPTFQVPTLILRGEHDPMLDPTWEPLAAIPAAETVTLRAQGHFPMVSDPTAFAYHLMTLLERVEPSS